MSLRPGSSASTTGWSGACARSGVTGNVRIPISNPISNLISALIAGRALGPLGGQLAGARYEASHRRDYELQLEHCSVVGMLLLKREKEEKKEKSLPRHPSRAARHIPHGRSTGGPGNKCDDNNNSPARPSICQQGCLTGSDRRLHRAVHPRCFAGQSRRAMTSTLCLPSG